MQHDSHTKLSPLTLVYHWTMAIAMISMLSLGLYLHELKNGTPLNNELIYYHKTAGVIVLCIALARIFWRYTNGFFTPAGQHKVWETMLARWIHIFLLVGTIAMPVSGIIAVVAFGCEHCVVPLFGLIDLGPFPQILPLAGISYAIHEYGGKLLILAILLHAAAALKHHYWDKNGTLRRMLGQEI